MLICGILSTVYYVVINVFVPMYFEGYSSASQTVSELSAISAPTRRLWVFLAVGYIILFAAFGLGILKSVTDQRLRVVGWLIVVYSIVNVYWPPMHLRGNEPTLTDTLHIVWAGISVVLMLLMMGFAAAALGKGFRAYTILSAGLLALGGYLTSKDAANIPLNLPTPWMGIWERLMIGVFMLWVIVLAVTLMRRGNQSSVS